MKSCFHIATKCFSWFSKNIAYYKNNTSASKNFDNSVVYAFINNLAPVF